VPAKPADPGDPLHDTCSPATMWSAGNVAEAMPGVPTPLSWSIQGPGVNLGAHRAFVDMGVLPTLPGRRPDPLDPDVANLAIFHGHPVGNVNTVLRVVAAMPGNTVEAVMSQVFGAPGPPPAGIRDTARRYPVIAVRLPWAVATLQRRMRATDARVRAFRQANLPADPTRSRSVLREGAQLFTAAVRPQALATFIGQGLYQQVAALATLAGRPGLERKLISGYGGVEETAIATGLWEVAHGSLPLDRFLAEHGHHGPDEGELSNASWRERPALLDGTLSALREQPPDRHPAQRALRQSHQRAGLETELLAGLPAHRRPSAALTLRMARRYLPLREAGRSTMHRVFDVMRAHARTLGSTLHGDGTLPDADAVFHLTLNELLGTLPPDATDLIAHRRQRREHYRTLEIPAQFTGVPEALPAAGDAVSGRDGAPVERGLAAVAGTPVVRGLAVAAGTLEGTARVVRDPTGGVDVRDGEILVCHTTDPSWISLMVVAGGLVTDIGSALSHAAIVARELGIPCVVGAEGATSTIRTGDLLRLDGDAGTVEIIRLAL